MGIHALSSSIKSLPLLTCSMLWFIPKTKYYKNNVNSTEYNQLLSALAAVKERYILLKARELTQLSAKVAMFWQIFHLTPRPCSSTLQGSTQLIYHMQDVHKRKALSVWLPHALGFDRALRDTTEVTVSTHWHAKEKLCFSSVINGALLRQVSPHREWGSSLWARQAISVPWATSENASTTHRQQLPEKGSSDMNTYTHVHTRACKHTAKGSEAMRKGDGRTPCNSRRANSGSLTSASRKTSHLWQLLRPKLC